MSKGLVFASVDIEADGPNPMTNSMLSIGIVFTDETGKILHEYGADLEPLKGHHADPLTLMEFWSQHQDEWKRIRQNAQYAGDVMRKIHDLCVSRFKDYKVVWVARPAAYDWQWVSSYANLYLGDKWKYFKAECISTMRNIYWEMIKPEKKEDQDAAWSEFKGYIAKWTEGTAMTHNALDDARYQAALFHGLRGALKPILRL